MSDAPAANDTVWTEACRREQAIRGRHVGVAVRYCIERVFNADRFDLGFYAGRVYGLMAASLVLLVLLIEIGAVYARLARSFAAERGARDQQLREVQSELIHVCTVT
jgi:hypothetical protein